MTSISRFHVRLYGFRASSLAALNRGGSSDPYLDINFDNYKTFETEVVKKSLNPEWEEDVSFVYETRMAHKLHLKRLKIKCYNKSTFLSDSLIGKCYLDLYSVFTGPSTIRLPLRDGRKIRGEIQFRCEVEENPIVEINLRNLKLEFPTEVDEVFGSHANDYYLEYGYTGESENADIRKSPLGRNDFQYLDALYIRATYDELMKESLRFWLKKKKQTSDNLVIATADLTFKDHHAFQDGYLIEFRLPVELTDEFCREQNVVYPDVGRILGSVFFSGFPQFLQMESGYFTDNGIYYAQYKDPNVINKPKVFVHGLEGQSRQHHENPVVAHPPSNDKGGQSAVTHPPKKKPTSSNGTNSAYVPAPKKDAQREEEDEAPKSSYPFAHLGPGNSSDNSAEKTPSYPFAHLIPGSSEENDSAKEGESSPQADDNQPHPFEHLVRAAQSAGEHEDEDAQEEEGAEAEETPEESDSEDGGDSEDSIAATQEHKHRQEISQAFEEEHQQAEEETQKEGTRMSKDSQGLPWFWERAFLNDGRVYFKNHAYKSTEWKLPTEPTYSALILYPGPIGLELEPNWSGEKKFGPAKKSGRRFSNYDLGAVVAGVRSDGQAAQATRGRIKKGHQIIAMNQVSLLQYNFKACLQMIAKSKRPVRLVFLDPYAVSEDLARNLENPDTPSPPPRSSSGGPNNIRSGGVSHPLPNQQPQERTVSWQRYTDAEGNTRYHKVEATQRQFTEVSNSGSADASFNVPQPHVAMGLHGQAFGNFFQRVSASQAQQVAPGDWIMVRDSVGNMCYRHTGTNKISYSWPPH
eukprot:gb/GECG01011437.1/.p1 GENE.gb/GECG01011437.1/~~gb/GECG01011437.1/.p1  ORF type:complete len:804 (+),score=104.43 gb/GECG01011437.1/:1-2412(+)